MDSNRPGFNEWVAKQVLARKRLEEAAPELLRMLCQYHDYFADYDLDREFPDFNTMKDEALTLIDTVRGLR